MKKLLRIIVSCQHIDNLPWTLAKYTYVNQIFELFIGKINRLFESFSFLLLLRLYILVSEMIEFLLQNIDIYTV